MVEGEGDFDHVLVLWAVEGRLLYLEQSLGLILHQGRFDQFPGLLCHLVVVTDPGFFLLALGLQLLDGAVEGLRLGIRLEECLIEGWELFGEGGFAFLLEYVGRGGEGRWEGEGGILEGPLGVREEVMPRLAHVHSLVKDYVWMRVRTLPWNCLAK